MEDRNKTIHSWRICQRNPLDGNYPYSFNDLFIRVHKSLPLHLRLIELISTDSIHMLRQCMIKATLFRFQTLFSLYPFSPSTTEIMLGVMHSFQQE